MKICPDNKSYLTAASNKLIQLWNIDHDKPIHTFEENKHDGMSILLIYKKKELYVA